MFHNFTRHEFQIFEHLKFGCLKNENFRNDIKYIFPFSQVLSFRHTKQTSKYVTDSTFT